MCGDSGHAEAVRTHARRILGSAICWRCSSPFTTRTTLNRQGHDTGSQYRSAILPHGATACNKPNRLLQHWTQSAAGRIRLSPNGLTLACFIPQKRSTTATFDHHPQQPYCRAVIGPKVAKLQQYFIHLAERHPAHKETGSKPGCACPVDTPPQEIYARGFPCQGELGKMISSMAGLPALQGGEPGRVRKEAATAAYCKCRGSGSPPLPSVICHPSRSSLRGRHWRVVVLPNLSSHSVVVLRHGKILREST